MTKYITLALVLLACGRAAAGDSLLTGKMAMYNYLLSGSWTCTLGSATYFAKYNVESPNVLHGHLFSKGSSEDAYFGYDDKRAEFWTVNADSTGATESQWSPDGVTFTGTLNAEKVTANATNVITKQSDGKWMVAARGTSEGQPYDVTATCVR